MDNTLQRLIPFDTLALAAERLRTLAHPHRLRMLQMILQHRYTVTQLAEGCDIPPSTASEHLRKMRDRGLLCVERQGRRILYRAADEQMAAILNCIENRYGVGEFGLGDLEALHPTQHTRNA